MSYLHLLTQKEGNAFIIKINRESKLNALDIDTLQEIKYAVLSVQNDPEVRGIILTGVGTKAFAAGADISEFAGFNVKQGTQMSEDGHSVMNTIETSAIPVIAAVNGYSLGGGCELAMACHIRVASENARFGQPEINLGLPPGYGGTQRLVQLVGKGKSLEMLLTAEPINAQEALSLGLVSKVVPMEELMNTCHDYINKFATKSPSAISMVISCINDHFKGTFPGFEKEISEFGRSFETKDFKEGTTAFLEKRKPNF